MIARPFLALVLLSVLVTGACAAQGPTDSTARPAASGSPVQPTIGFGQNGMDTSFARIETDPRPLYEGPASPVEARILVKGASGAEDAFILMFGFNGLSDSVSIKLTDLETADGVALRIHQDNRTDGPRQPKVWVKPEDLPLDEEIVLKGTVVAQGNGQFHVGAIVIAFDEAYGKFVTPQNEYAEVYAFGLLGAVGVDSAGAPFQGQGNVPAPGVVVTLAAVLMVLRRRR